MLEQDRLVVLPLKGGFAGKGPVEHGPKAVEVGLGGEGKAFGLLGGHVGGGAQGVAGAGEVAAFLQEVGQAEVHHLGVALLGEEDVFGGEVPVEDALGVEVGQGLHHLLGRLQDALPLRALLKGAQAVKTPPPPAP